MLKPKIQLSLERAKKYFEEHMSVGDYYSEGLRVPGEWFGLGAEKLGLKGQVTKEAFLALCEGKNPNTGERLTLRLNTVRNENGKVVANRRIYCDFVISPTKSISVVALYQDSRIIKLHDGAADKAMRELEKYALGRIRKSNQEDNRVTGNVVGAKHRHDTSRELDPHLHTHYTLFTATHDAVEDCWKALQVVDMFRAQKFAENVYYHELTKGLIALGYEMEQTAKGPEIRQVPISVRKLFSKRHEQINEETKKQIEKNGVPWNVNDLREQVAVDSRQRKIKDSTAERLRPEWEKQMSPEERKALDQLRNVTPVEARKADASKAVVWAEEHLFERRSIVKDYELLSAALAHGRGENFSLEELMRAMDARKYEKYKGTRKITTKENLECELEIVFAAQDGKRKFSPLNRDYTPDPLLSKEQASAVKQILSSRDLITLFRGAAGTGKSFALKKVYDAILTTGQKVVVLAPQRQQVLDLEKSGMPAQTVAALFVEQKLPPNAVVMVDEAGQIGGKQMRQLIRLVKASQGRLILSGDTRQHGAVTASDALRAIEKYGEIKPAEITKIRRQDLRLAKSKAERSAIKTYREAAKLASKGEALKSFERLNKLGWVRELPEEERRVALAVEYNAALEQKETAVVVAQTWNEVWAVNQAIRGELIKSSKLSIGEAISNYQAVDCTEAQKKDQQLYKDGQYVCFLQRYGRYAKGEFCPVVGATPKGIVISKNGRNSTLSYRYASRLVVAQAATLDVAPGERLQLKFNGKSKEGAALTNGELVTVKKLLPNGEITVVDEGGKTKTLLPSQRLFTHGYAITSYASQGKTADVVIFSDSGVAAATNKSQWYVAMTRGRKRALVFTSDKAELQNNISKSGERELALDGKTAELKAAQNAKSRSRIAQTWENIRRAQNQQSVQNNQTTHRGVSI